MPPKKSQKTDDDSPPCSTLSHLQQHFSTLPQSTSSLKNGHVLQVFLSSHRSRAETERKLQSAFPKERLPAVLKSRIKSLGVRNSKFRQRNVKEFEQFREMCSETFILAETSPLDVKAATEEKDDSSGDVPALVVPQIVIDTERPGQFHETVPSPAPEPAASHSFVPCSDPDPSCCTTQNLVSLSPPDPSSSVVSTRFKSQPVTPQEAKLRRRLDFAQKRIVKNAKAYKTTIKALRDKLKVPRRVRNQALKRKDKQIQKKTEKIKALEAKFEGNELALELKAVRQELTDLKSKHEKLKAYHKKKKKTTATVPLHKYRKVQRELTLQKEDLEVQLQEERETAETSSSVIRCKKDGKTFSCNYRRCVYSCLLNQVPVEATGQLIKDIVTEITSLIPDSVADASTVSQCAYELGILADIQVGEALHKEKNLNIAWDATSLDAEHVNEIHINCNGPDGGSPKSLVLQIAGGQTAHSVHHICKAIQDVCNSYCEFNNIDSLEFHRSVVTKLQSTISDRVGVNHCVSVQLEDYISENLSSPSLEMLEPTKSAPVHSIQSERTLGRTGGQCRRAPNATTGFIDAKVKAKKNSTLNWLKSKPSDEQERLIEYAIKRAKKYRLIRKERETKTTLAYQKNEGKATEGRTGQTENRKKD